MKRSSSIITNLILITLIAAFGCAAAAAQRTESDIRSLQDIRPFDFSDEYYSKNGVQPHFIINRPTGTDAGSVFTKTADHRFNGIRILETFPAYNFDGSILYFNMYGQLFSRGFQADESGTQALEIAKAFPMFVFPSTTLRGNNRQANIIEARDDYALKNPLGLSLIVEVEYTFRADSAEDRQYLKELGQRNGYSSDGTPIIKTVDEVNYLTRLGLATQKIKGLDSKGEAPFAIAKVSANR